MMPYKLREWISVHECKDAIDWDRLSRNPNAIHLLEANPHKIDWHELSTNPNIFTYDYEQMTKNKLELNRELIEYYWRPERIEKYLRQGIDLE